MQRTSDGEAFGRPGIELQMDSRRKRCGGHGLRSFQRHIWFTFWNGILTEVYYPTVDRPQIRDLQYLVTDGKSFFHEERRNLQSKLERLSEQALGYRCTNSDPAGRYSIVKEIIADPHYACILQHTQITGDDSFISNLRLYALCAPHLEVGGWDNTGYAIEFDGRKLLMARKDETWLAMAATVPFSRVSCGYVGRSDGWTDLADNFQMDWEFDRASGGNIALTGELNPADCREFTLNLAFGETEHQAITTLFQALSTPFEQHCKRFIEQWDRAGMRILPLEKASGDGGDLYRRSFSLLRAHEDKSYPGAFIALTIHTLGEARRRSRPGGLPLSMDPRPGQQRLQHSCCR